MKVFEANIPIQVADFLNENLKQIILFNIANEEIFKLFRINNFFDNDEEFAVFKEIISENENILEHTDRPEYGDFQTEIELAEQITLHLVTKNISPEIIVEPTCGKGNFVLASMKTFANIKNIFAIEIFKPYVWEAKFNIIDFYLNNTFDSKPEISINHCSVFDFNFKEIADQFPEKELLIIGNPPWVTNSKLGSLNSSNLPKKTNFKNHNGLDAITGKSNFDIAEFITLSLIDTFQEMKGSLLLILKNSVIKNIVHDQLKNNFKLSEIQKHCINSKREFNVSVEASLFYCRMNSLASYKCAEFNFYDNQAHNLEFGWVDDKFVSNIDKYKKTKELDKIFPFTWRQGLKHDCSAIMELDKVNGHYMNGLNEEVKLEDDLIYGILKSSDLKNTVITDTRKFTIVTQKKVGQDTQYIKYEYPKTYQYLIDHRTNFEDRKSSIYNNKPLFSIFGIGDYSFKPFKVAISGLYKTFHFTLILPQNSKPIMLDDTCYLIGFDEIEFAVYTLILLNTDLTKQFLQSITFPDAKRTFTKDALMRIDLLGLAKKIENHDIQHELERLNELYNIKLDLNKWDNFILEMQSVNKKGQIAMFI